MKDINRVVIKIGTSVIADSNSFDYDLLKEIFDNIVSIINKGIDVIIVTSGAVGLGALTLDIHEKPTQTYLKQAISTIGQSKIMCNYAKMAEEHNKNVAQFLITRDVIEDVERRNKLKKAMDFLLKQGVIPIVNENDAVVFGDIQIGDNDTVSAIIADITKSDALILVSDVNGIYDKNPKEYCDARRIKIITNVNNDIINYADDKTTGFTSGGMLTKLNSAKIAQENKFNMYIVDGNKPESLIRLINGDDVGTGFIFRS